VSNDQGLWIEQQGDGPVFATAIHAGHDIREELLPFIALGEAERSREEDPYTDYWVRAAQGWIAARRSRFEVDLNRPPEEAVYQGPEMAWGLPLWRRPLPDEVVAHSLQEYNAFYDELKRLLDAIARHHKYFVVFDLHAYNYRREGPHAPPADALENPDVNVGTGSLDRKRFAPVVECVMEELRRREVCGRRLEVVENIKFKGRELARWIHSHYPGSACVLALEFKKFFMDEWTGVGDIDCILSIREALERTIPAVMDALRKLP